MGTKLILKHPAFEVHIEGDTATQIFEQASFWGSIPQACPVCGAMVTLKHRRTKTDDDYYEIICVSDGVKHKSQLGIYKKPEGALYYKQNERWTDIVGQPVEYDHKVEHHGNGHQNGHQQEKFTPDQEPMAEHERLNQEIFRLWKELGEKRILNDVIKQRFDGRTLKELFIAEKRAVLDGLQNSLERQALQTA